MGRFWRLNLGIIDIFWCVLSPGETPTDSRKLDHRTYNTRGQPARACVPHRFEPTQILDEATSALDSKENAWCFLPVDRKRHARFSHTPRAGLGHSEALVQESLDKLMKNRTTS
ncbi:MAG: hypothetical protein BJ554DRAFT_904 [Olpidium bornovanus]|uniref:Uncharacterized protein n=1 Tax=Olpidium bornovanus TaxID=278681 RepID=A0A8H7ZSU9_9FUNG|nr:MAG: hypothetical protein BJ554DRAFT_904 [Olpidium bornovanus]